MQNTTETETKLKEQRLMYTSIMQRKDIMGMSDMVNAFISS